MGVPTYLFGNDYMSCRNLKNNNTYRYNDNNNFIGGRIFFKEKRICVVTQFYKYCSLLFN